MVNNSWMHIKKVCVLLFLAIAPSASGQYDITALNFGLVAGKGMYSIQNVGLGTRVEYAYNCSTTFMLEYNHLFSVPEDQNFDNYNEVALGVNLIMFNWYPTTITAGFGYMLNDSSYFENIKEDAFLAFQQGNINHGAQIKLRALHQLSQPIHIFAEYNLKSLGRQYDSFLIGFSYDFEAK